MRSLPALVAITAALGLAQTPAVSQIQNNYSYILPGLPNYGIAPGSLFIVQGTNLNAQPLSALQSSVAPGIPTTLNGTSVSVTVGETTVKPGLYYTSPTQLAAVLPSNTPVGTGTLTVTNGTQTSATASIQVVASALGLDTLYGGGGGLIVATDLKGNLITFANAAAPGQFLTLWGSGVGADTSNDDKTYPLHQNDLTGIPLLVYVGGVQASVIYRGRSQYPGVDQVNIQIPATLANGCYVSVAAVSGSVVSNFGSIPVNAGGGPCVDSTLGVNGTLLQSLSGKPRFSFSTIFLTQSTSATGVESSGSTAIFENYPYAASNSVNGNTIVSVGGCVVNPQSGGASPQIFGLDIGSLTLSGPNGAVAVAPVPGFLGAFSAGFSNSFIPSSGGAFTFSGTGGKDVGAFSTTITFPAPLFWANKAAGATVNRAQGLPVVWNDAVAGTYVTISGSSTTTIAGQATSVGFTCLAPAAGGQFTVPAYVLAALPAGTGTVTLREYTLQQQFTPQGLDIAIVYGSVGTAIASVYQ